MLDPIYVDWIVDRPLGVPEWNRYKILFKILSSIPYRWDALWDESRAMDGKRLRREFIRTMNAYHMADEIEDQPCSVLEMLAAFAIRIEDDYIGDPDNPKPFLIFIEMLKNLKVWKTDYDLWSIREQDKVHRNVERWLDKDYLPNGTGSIFPIRRTDRDLRKVSLWSQMNEYIHVTSR